jgi:hypothetical protein
MVLLQASPDEIALAVVDGHGQCYRCRLRRDATDVVVPDEPDVLGRAHGTKRVATLHAADGRHLLATADEYGEVRLWDLDRPGVAVAGWLAHRDPVDALVTNDPGDRSDWALATIGKGAGVTRVWPTSALGVPASPTGERQVRKVVVAGGQAALAGRQELTLVDACQGPSVTDRFFDIAITDVAAFDGQDPRIVVATRDRLWCWSPSDSSASQIWQHPEPLSGIFASTFGGNDYLITLDHHGALRRWDPRDGRPEADTAETHVIRPAGMVGYHDGDDVVIAIGGDGVVVRWHCRPGGIQGWAQLPPVACEKLPQALSSVSGDIDDPAMLFVVTDDQIICTAGRDEQRWRTAAPPRPKAAAAWRTDIGDVRLAVGNAEGELYLFDGAKGHPTRTIPTGLGINSITAAVLDGRLSLIVGAREGAVAIDLHDTAEAKT